MKYSETQHDYLHAEAARGLNNSTEQGNASLNKRKPPCSLQK